MDSKRKRRLAKILILASILGISVITALFLLAHRKHAEPTGPFRSASKLAYAKGISFTEYRGEKKVYSVKIDTFSVERARLGPFAIGPLRIAQFNKVNVDIYLDGIESKDQKPGATNEGGRDGDLLDFENPISRIKENLPGELKKIRGFKVKDVSVSLWKNDERVFRISSDAADFDQKTRDLIFAGHAMIDSGKNGKLLSHRIRWNSKTRLFRAAGPYLLEKDGRREGAGIEVDYLFRQVHYKTSGE